MITIAKLNINQINLKLFSNTQNDINNCAVFQVDTTLH